MTEHKAAKPAKTNEAWVAELMDVNNPKNEMEWAAFHEIRRLRAEKGALVELRPMMDGVDDLSCRVNDAFDHINSLSRRVDRLLHVVDKLHRGEKVEIGEREDNEIHR